ncbi:MAG: DUF4062 domain-containing protein [Nitrospira sp. CG24B]|nr:MAG: DUF4062 domain-containing protein [Nitrospira sp. CG24B]
MSDVLCSYDRQIRVFISSTFRDMKEERDYLVKYTFPWLRKLCESRGVIWGDVDLRWGITDEDQAEGKVLPVCLEEIHRCRPYFIGLLGERYGWVPEQIPDELAERQPWLQAHRARSITELEIQHGVLRHESLHGRAFFYFRDPAYLDRLPAGSVRGEFASESPEAQAKLAFLKARLRSAQTEGICLVREPYPDPQTLGQWILEDFTALIDDQFPEGSQLDPLDQEALEHAAFAQSRARVYIGRQEYFERLDTHVTGEGPPLIVLGESGSGKSALLANWFLRYQKAHPKEFVLIHFIGATPYSADWQMMLRHILSEFKRWFDIREEIPTDPATLRSTFAIWLHRAAAKDRMVLILDALNQMEDREGAQDLIWLPPVIPANVRMIFSTLPGRALDNLSKRGWPTLTVQPLHDAERRALIAEYLAQSAKALSSARITRIVTAPQTANPLYLRILLDELRLHGLHDTLESTVTHYLEAETIPDLYGKVLARWERDYEGDTDLIGEALSFLWAARRGLSETEWRELLGTDGQPLVQATFAPFLLAAESGLVNRSGLWTFAHQYLREAVREAYVPTTKHQQVAHRKLADYFSMQPLATRHLDERSWQLAEAAAWKELAQLLGEEQFFLSVYKWNEYEVLRYWARIEQQSSERMVETYRLASQLNGEAMPTIFLHAVARLLKTSGHLTESFEICQALQDHARHAADLVILEASLATQALILKDRGDIDSAMRLLQGQERLSRELGNLLGVAISLGNQANIHKNRGSLDIAMKLYREEERLCRELGDPAGVARSLGNQARILKVYGNPDGAIKLHQEEERLCRELGDPARLAALLGDQAHIEYDRGDVDSAMKQLQEQERLCRELGDPARLASSLGDQAYIEYNRGNLDKAMKLSQEQERLCRELGNPVGLATSLGDQALIFKARGNLDVAMKLHQE